MPFTITVLPKGLSFTARADETLLAAAEKAGFAFRHSCDAGSCQICEGVLRQGTVLLKHNKALIKHTDLQANSLLFCLAVPTTDCVIEAQNVLAPGELPVITAACQVHKVHPLNDEVTEVFLKLPAGKKIEYYPGQYLEILLGDDACAFSIANAPTPTNNIERLIELHIRNQNDSPLAIAIAKKLVVGEMVKIALPKGSCVLPDSIISGTPSEPIIFLAGSTGFSPVKAMLEACFNANNSAPLYLYWGGRQAKDFYLHDLALRWAEQYPNFTYVPVVSEPENSPEWQGRTGFVHHAVLADFNNTLDTAFVIGGGSPGMVWAAHDDFIKAGMKPENMISDVFAYAPRD